TLHEEHSVTTRKSRIGGSLSGGVLSVGSTKTRSSEQDSTDSTYQVASTVASRSGSVTVEAGKTLTVGGSDLAAGQDLSLKAADIVLEARQDTTEYQATQTSTSSGFSIGVTV